MPKMIMFKKVEGNKLGENTLFSLLAKAVAAVFYFITDIIIANVLDKDTYGEWCFFYSITAMLFLIIGFGINASIRVKVARERECRKKQNSCICIGLNFRCFIGIIAFLILCLVSRPLAYKLGYPMKYPELKMLILIGAFWCLANSFSEYYKAVYMGMEKFNYVFYLALAEYGGYFVFGLVFLYFSKNIYGLEIGYIVALLAVVFCGRLFYTREFTKQGYGRSTDIFEKNIKKEVVKDAIPFLTAACGTLIFADIDTFMLGAFSVPYEVGVYSIAKNLINKVTHVNLAICAATMPTFAYINKKNVVDRQKLFNKILNANILIALAIMFVMGSLGPPAIVLLYGGAYLEAGQILHWLLPYFFLYMIQLVFSTLMDYQGYIKLRSFFYFMAMGLNVILNYCWIPTYGARGAAIATSVSMIPYDVFMIVSVVKIFNKYKRAQNVK